MSGELEPYEASSSAKLEGKPLVIEKNFSKKLYTFDLSNLGTFDIQYSHFIRFSY